MSPSMELEGTRGAHIMIAGGTGRPGGITDELHNERGASQMRIFPLLLLLFSSVASADLYQMPGAIFVDDNSIIWSCIPVIMKDEMVAIRCATNKKENFCFVEDSGAGSFKCILTGEIEA